MAVAKWILVGGTGLLGLGALAFGVMGATSLSNAGPQAPVAISQVAVRPFPVMGARAAPTERAADAGTTPPAADAGVAAPTPTPAPAPTPAPTPPPAPAPKPDAGAAAPKPPAAPPQPVGEGYLNLRASDTADVFVDGKKVGGSPIEGLKVKAGTHKVRFDCYDAAGNTLPGATKTVTVAADAEASVDFPCPVAE
ncbi:MAG: hypothetical protein MUC96_21315 [Myxococcaceae bacterium]|jgi:hypothetical protein|nr:hypothetical protein [Myxococcaceae bacterium]